MFSVEAGIGLADDAAQDPDRGLLRAKKVVVGSGGHAIPAADVAIAIVLGTDVEIGRHPQTHPGRQDQHPQGQHHPQKPAGKPPNTNALRKERDFRQIFLCNFHPSTCK